MAQQYAADGRKVRAMLQQDMTAWVKAGTPEVIGIVTDFVNTKFTAFLVTLIDAYGMFVSFSQHGTYRTGLGHSVAALLTRSLCLSFFPS